MIPAAHSTSKQNDGNNASNINQAGSWNRSHGSDVSARAKQPLCRWRSGGGVVVQRSVGGPPSTRPPRQQSSIPRAERLSDGSLLGSQPADHFISHYRPLSDLTRFPQLYAALTYNMCILLPSCQENPRSCPSRQRTVQALRRCANVTALARLVSLISHVSLQALG